MVSSKLGQVTVRGVFAAGSRVRLVRVVGEHVLRSAGGGVVASGVVGGDGGVVFKGLEVGARFMVVGRIDGELREVRCVGRPAGEESSVLLQPSVAAEPERRGLDGVRVEEPAGRPARKPAARKTVKASGAARTPVVERPAARSRAAKKR